MVIKPTGFDFSYEEKKQSQINGVAVLAFVLLLFISSGAAIWMAIEKVRVFWIILELLGLNIIGIYILLAFKVAPGQSLCRRTGLKFFKGNRWK